MCVCVFSETEGEATVSDEVSKPPRQQIRAKGTQGHFGVGTEKRKLRFLTCFSNSSCFRSGRRAAQPQKKKRKN